MNQTSNQKILQTALFGLIMCFVSSCEKREDEPCITKLVNYSLDEFYNPTFKDVNILEIDSIINVPPYFVTGNSFGPVKILGDSSIILLSTITPPVAPCELFRLIDKQTMRPTLQWKQTPGKLIAAAIFDTQIFADNEKTSISNYGRAVWAWDSNLKTGAGASGGTFVVTYDQGRAVTSKGLISPSDTARSLKSNSLYFWAVWIWDDQGQRIVKMSKQIPFITTNGEVPVTANNQPAVLLDGGNWVLDSALDSLGNDVSNQLPLKNLAFSFSDCKSGTVTIKNSKSSPQPYNVKVTTSPTIHLTFDIFDLSNLSCDCYSFTCNLNYNSQTLTARFIGRN